MSESEKPDKQFSINYYFTIGFTIIGTALVYLFLNYSIENIQSIKIISILLAAAAGGIPFGIFGAYLDLKIAELKFKKEQVTE